MLAGIKAFLQDKGGNFATIMALVAIPLIGAVAGAADYSMASRAKSFLQDTLDTSLLAAGREDGGLAARQGVVNEYIEAHARDLAVENIAVNVTETPSGHGLHGTLTAEYKPFMLGILGIDKFDITVTSEVMSGSDANLDMALVLDNTASLGASGLAAVRAAAHRFQATIQGSAGNPDLIQMAVVPFAGAVNVGRDFSTQFLDMNAQAPEHARRMENIVVGQVDPAGCTPDWGGPPNDPGTGGVEGALLHMPDWMDRAGGVSKTMFAELFGVKPAFAGEAQDHGLPTGYWMTNAANCRFIVSPPVINNFDLFNGLNNIKWGGCVEARADGYDTTDLPANSGNPSSLFVPYFWPDELDPVDSSTPIYTNNYMTDEATPGTPPWTPPTWAGWDGWGRTISPTKYTNRTVTLLPGGQYVSGPNRGCPQPLTPLTKDMGDVSNAIDAMTLVDAGGTVISEGAAWGWRVLSPAAPFQQTSKNPKTKRIMLIMSDGENQLSRNPKEPRYPGGPDYKTSATVSDYNAYGYLRDSRFGASSTFDSAQAEIDARTLQICDNAKRDGIEIFTVLFNSTDSRAVDTLSRCATAANKHFFLAKSADDLDATFRDIAASVGRYRLVQ